VDQVIVDNIPQMHRPVLLAAFRGWNDGGESATAALEYMSIEWSAERFARIDSEDFYDFQATRPTVELVDGTTRRIEWPTNEFHHAKVVDRDVVLFVGVEPNLRWRTFCNLILGIAKELQVEQIITLGAFLADVPHSRDVPIVGSAADLGTVEELGLQPSRYEGPTGITGVLHDAANKAGIVSISFWAGVPHYIGSGVNPKGALALTRRACSFLGLPIDTNDLEVAAAQWVQTVNEQLAENEALSFYVRRLEAAEEGDFNVVEPTEGGGLADEIERFLQENGAEGPED
jgi:proteasome assembly chaperone (PAC2) family protein